MFQPSSNDDIKDSFCASIELLEDDVLILIVNKQRSIEGRANFLGLSNHLIYIHSGHTSRSKCYPILPSSKALHIRCLMHKAEGTRLQMMKLKLDLCFLLCRETSAMEGT